MEITMAQKRGNLVAELNKYKARLEMEMRGRMVPTAKAANIRQTIQAIRNEIREIDREAAERLALEKAPVDEVLEVIAIPLLADVMNDLVAGVNGMLRRNGLQESVFGDYARTIQRAALAMVNTLDHSEANLPRLLDVDDHLVDAVKKKLMSFIKQHLNITK